MRKSSVQTLLPFAFHFPPNFETLLVDRKSNPRPVAFTVGLNAASRLGLSLGLNFVSLDTGAEN